MPPASVHKRLAVVYGVVGGAALGATFGAWTLAAQPPGRAAIHASGAQAPTAPRCPDGYAPSAARAGMPPSGSGSRLLVRCDPRASQAAFSEALDLYWTDEMYLDARVRADALTRFVRESSEGGALVLQPLGNAHEASVGEVRAIALDVDATYQMPPLRVRVWLLPARRNTLQVTMVAPRARFAEAEAEARGAIERVQGLGPYEHTAPSARGWNVRVECPSGYTDATEPDGGPARIEYVGRACLSPDVSVGTELTFAELAERAEDEHGVRRLFELAAATLSATGVRTGQGFGPTEPARAGGVEGWTARLDVDPPSAPVRLRASVLPADRGTLFALSVAMPEHAAEVRATTERWLRETHLLRAYAPDIVRARRRARIVGVVLIPAVLTALLGAAIGNAFRKKA